MAHLSKFYMRSLQKGLRFQPNPSGLMQPPCMSKKKKNFTLNQESQIDIDCITSPESQTSEHIAALPAIPPRLVNNFTPWLTISEMEAFFYPLARLYPWS